MCGICGIYYKENQREVSVEDLKTMCTAMTHRGPNDEGYFAENAIGLGMRRLSIIDRAFGKQPQFNEDKSIVVVFNGEIYNYFQLRTSLEKQNHIFQTNSDTEVLVHLYEEYSTAMMSHLNGMFAFALYDRTARRLLLARDRMGAKPLYYFENNKQFIFCSEIKSISQLNVISSEIDTEALHHYLTFRFVPSPRTLFKDIKKLEAGCFIELSQEQNQVQVHTYWDIDLNRPIRNISEQEACAETLSVVNDAVKIRLMSEVPLGIMLSGGIDSAVVTAAMRKSCSNTISTFTIDYQEDGPHREGAYAKIIAEHFSTDHHEIIIKFGEFMQTLEQMIYFMDEPIADPAAIAIYDLCKFSKQFVTVLLSGVGGDEIFGGYTSYDEAVYRSLLRWIPQSVWTDYIHPFYSKLPVKLPGSNFIRRLGSSVESMFLGSSPLYGGFSELEKSKLYTPDFYESMQKNLSSHTLIKNLLTNVAKSKSELQKMMYIDLKFWLADSHMIMMDKMSMAHSIELREPLLDYRMVEWAFRLPDTYKRTITQSKIILKKAFLDQIPLSIIQRRKRGFSTPLNLWFKKYHVQVSELLILNKAMIHEYINKSSIKNLIQQHTSGLGDYSPHLFSLLVLELWLNKNCSRK